MKKEWNAPEVSTLEFGQTETKLGPNLLGQFADFVLVKQTKEINSALENTLAGMS